MKTKRSQVTGKKDPHPTVRGYNKSTDTGDTSSIESHAIAHSMPRLVSVFLSANPSPRIIVANSPSSLTHHY